jgi:glycosyltransferase involved in cell wall biosynthesis
MPKVSIIIPVFNSERYLPQCIESVLGQTFEDIEIICVDDGSTDNSFNILNKYAIKEKRIKLLTQKNAGQGAARNTALKQAQGEYIYFLDSDDYIDSTLIEECIKTIEDTHADLVCFNTEVFGDDTSRLYARAKKYSQLKFSGLLRMEGAVREGLNVYLWNKFFKRYIIEEYEILFPEDLMYEDITFVKSYLLACEKGYFDMRRFHHYRIHDNSLMKINYKSEKTALDHFKNWHEILKIVSKNREHLIHNKDVLEKWLWDYYFLTKSLLKTPYNPELEELKSKYYEEFSRLLSLN